MKEEKKWFDDPFFVRNLIYGVEDSLISTTGVVVGVAMAGFPNSQIVITGAILVLVEALSMGFGSFVSEDNFMNTAKMKYDLMTVWKYALVMFMSYVAAGVLPLLPFLLSVKGAWVWSIVIALIALFALIYYFQQNTKKASIQTIIGSIILYISTLAGKSFG